MARVVVLCTWLQHGADEDDEDIGEGEEGGTRGDTCESDPQARQSEEGEGRENLF